MCLQEWTANIRTLIKRHLPALERFSTVFTAQTVKRGQKTTEYYLDKRQATFITTQSGTENAIDITIQLIERFDAYERGEITSGKSPAVGDDEAAKIAFHTAHETMKEVPDASEGDRILIAARIAQKTTGINPLASLGIDELPTVSLKKTSMRDKWRAKGRSGSAKGKRASERRGGCSFVELSPSEKYITATRIGQLIGMTARDVNKVLAEMGFQKKVPKDHSGNWALLSKGAPYANVEVVTNGSDGYTFITWDVTVLGMIAEYLNC